MAEEKKIVVSIPAVLMEILRCCCWVGEDRNASGRLMSLLGDKAQESGMETGEILLEAMSNPGFRGDTVVLTPEQSEAVNNVEIELPDNEFGRRMLVVLEEALGRVKENVVILEQQLAALKESLKEEGGGENG